MEYVTLVRTWIREMFGFSAEVQIEILSSLLAIFFIWLIRRGILFVVARRTEEIRILYRWRKSSSYVAFAIGIFLIGRIWFEGFASLSTYLGLLSAGLAVALRDPIVNLAGWAFIIWRRPFEVGDRIQLGNCSGDVIDQRIFAFILMEIGNWVDADQSTGRVIHVPNGKIFNEVLGNYSKGFQYIWNEMPVLVTFESDWKAAKKLLLQIGARSAEHITPKAEKHLREAAKKFLIFYSKLTPTVYTSVKDCGVLLTIRYLCEPRRRRGSEEAIWEAILEAFSRRPDIDFAYPTQRFFNNLSEGKEGMPPLAKERVEGKKIPIGKNPGEGKEANR